MTVKRALEIIDGLIDFNNKCSRGTRDMVNDWDGQPRRMADTIASIYEDESMILHLIKKELVPNCKHPKKMIDICEGKKYCMKCNSDVD